MPHPSQPPKDALNNELREGDIVAVTMDKPLIMRVMKIDNGGIQTPQGMTPMTTIVGVTLTIRGVPGLPILNLVKVFTPGSDDLIKNLIEH